MQARDQRPAKDLLSAFLRPKHQEQEPEQEPEQDDEDPSAGGLAAALGESTPLDDAEAILAENEAEPAAADAPDAETAAATAEPAAAGTRESDPAHAGGSLLMPIVGGLFLLGGTAVAVLQAQGRLPAALSGYGLQPATLFTVGAVVFGVGIVGRQLARLAAAMHGQQEAQQDLPSALQFLVERQHAAAERPPAAGEELERVLIALERLDEKVNNITRALKMYGKPLVEISNSAADVTGQVAQLKGQVDSMQEALQQDLQRVATVAARGGSEPAALEKRFAHVEEQLQKGLATLGDKLAQQGLQQQLTRVEASVQALGQRVDDSEVRKSLLRLEDLEKQRGKKLDELAKADGVQQDVHKLERQLELGLGKLGNALEQVRSGNLGPLENIARELQREIAGLATAVAHIQQAVRSGAARPAPAATAPAMAPVAPPPAAAPAAAPAPVHAAPAATAHAPAPAAPAAPGPAAAAGLSDAQAGVAQNHTGARATSSKNVLGAIAKLKKMKA